MSRQNARSNPPPELHIANRQRALRVDLARIRRLAHAAIPLCLDIRGPQPPVLPDLAEVSVAIISSTAMSRVHVDFLGIAGPTDVITFPYGEIVVCAEVARENALRYDATPDDELALYIIHGLLHLNGFDDVKPAQARSMHSRQAKILNAARKSLI
ncbi:MAG: rRNA maturation RNase YbeY [Chthoniobacterales bacterium]